MCGQFLNLSVFSFSKLKIPTNDIGYAKFIYSRLFIDFTKDANVINVSDLVTEVTNKGIMMEEACQKK